MSKTATTNEMSELHATTAKILKQRIEAVDCTAAELNAAIKFLKDNNIMVDPASDDLDELADGVEAAPALPFSAPDAPVHH